MDDERSREESNSEIVWAEGVQKGVQESVQEGVLSVKGAEHGALGGLVLPEHLDALAQRHQRCVDVASLLTKSGKLSTTSGTRTGNHKVRNRAEQGQRYGSMRRKAEKRHRLFRAS